MRITLVQAEIEAAVKNYVAAQGINISGKTVEVDITAGRGSNGFTADLNIEPVVEGFNPNQSTYRTTEASEPTPSSDVESDEPETLVEEDTKPKGDSLFNR